MDFSDNIFYKIIHGQAPSHKIYEDDDFLAILDIGPASRGHCLILPKIPAENIFDLADESAKGLYFIAKKLASAVKKVTNCDGINIIQNNGAVAGQIVPYFHLHIVPRYKGDDIEIKTTQHKLGDDAAELTKKLREAVIQ